VTFWALTENLKSNAGVLEGAPPEHFEGTIAPDRALHHAPGVSSSGEPGSLHDDDIYRSVQTGTQ